MGCFQVAQSWGFDVETFEEDLQHFIPLISDEKEILLFPLFPYNTPFQDRCKETGDCGEAYGGERADH